MNDASFNNPTVALPQQGLGVLGRVFVTKHLYLSAGLHDANGVPTEINFKSFFEVSEYHTWGEVGWSPSPAAEGAGDSVHVAVWHSDPRTEAAIDEGWGLAFSAAHTFGKRWRPFLRAGYSDGGDTLLSGLLSGGVGVRVRSDDLIGTAVSWGRPPMGEQPDRVTVEAFYRLQLTDNIQVTPGFHWTTQPAQDNSVWVGSVLRVRFVF